ncbi:hypothetical protein CWI37_0101p0020 [Hamiltosporidium tvaerminnensis]|uniref:Uncharacterized protein n=1 Tax=Hamiltosporidium tvaerminnensis TaxID=1176355 RepID=A0A4Q9LD30_9MICR|nr:hypothetical protein CWI37_0101p0020 [Hamiltosporidium tvaerminnensis]
MILILMYLLMKVCLCAINYPFEKQIDKLNNEKERLESMTGELNKEIKETYKICPIDSLWTMAYKLGNFYQKIFLPRCVSKKNKKFHDKITVLLKTYKKNNNHMLHQKYTAEQIKWVKEVLIEYYSALKTFLKRNLRKPYYIMIRKYYNDFNESIKENCRSNTNLHSSNIRSVEDIIKTINKLKKHHFSSIGNACDLIESILSGTIDFDKIPKLDEVILISDEIKKQYLEYTTVHRKKWVAFIEKNCALLI